MKVLSKAFVLVLCAALLVSATAFGTLAYLTDTQSVTNTFTVGKVAISLDEAKVNTMGQRLDRQGGIWKESDGQDALAPRVKSNLYHLVPGCTYVKDPTIHVDKDSEESYLYVELEIRDNRDLKKLLDKHDLDSSLWSLLEGSVPGDWKALGESREDAAGSRKYLLAYSKTVTGDKKADKDVKLFESISVPAVFTKEDLKTLDKFEIVITAYAVQAPTFETAEAAWNATFGAP